MSTKIRLGVQRKLFIKIHSLTFHVHDSIISKGCGRHSPNPQALTSRLSNFTNPTIPRFPGGKTPNVIVKVKKVEQYVIVLLSLLQVKVRKTIWSFDCSAQFLRSRLCNGFQLNSFLPAKAEADWSIPFVRCISNWLPNRKFPRNDRQIITDLGTNFIKWVCMWGAFN